MTGLFCSLPQRTCIEIRGADADVFLANQLARSVDAASPGTAPLAAWLDARGRVRALPRVVRRADHWLLIVERDLVERTVQKLGMFVLRSAVSIAAADAACGALIGADDAALAALGLPAATPLDGAVALGTVHAVRVGAVVWHVVGPAPAVDAFALGLERAPPTLAVRAEMALGIPVIGTAAAERYVAQMLNLDRLGAIAFDKGCYPGQEIVARVHNLGSVKRRLHRYSSAGSAPLVGAAVRTGAGTEVGEVVSAAAAPVGCELLAVVEHSAVGGELTVDGAPLEEQPLPFAVPRE